MAETVVGMVAPRGNAVGHHLARRAAERLQARVDINDVFVAFTFRDTEFDAARELVATTLDEIDGRWHRHLQFPRE